MGIPWGIESAIEEALEDAYDDGYARGQDDAQKYVNGSSPLDRLDKVVEDEHNEFHFSRWPVRQCEQPLCRNWTRLKEEMNAER